MAKKRFARWGAPGFFACRVTDAHSEAIEQHDSDIERLTKTEGRHRRRMEKIERRLEAHSQAIQRGHRSAYDAVTKLTTRIRALEGRRRWDEDDELALHALRILATNPRNQPPAPEPVVVEGEFQVYRDNCGRLVAAVAADFTGFLGKLDNVSTESLTIERIDDEDA